MPHFKKLAGDKCYLSPMTIEDAGAQAYWENDLAIAIPLGDEAFNLVSWEKMREQVDGALRSQAHMFSIVDLATDMLIGRCMLFAVDHVNRSAMLGMMIGEREFQGQGYGQEATRLLLDYAFNLLNLNSVRLGVFAFNVPALACYRKVGFREVGRHREFRIIAGRKYDMVLMDMLAEEFEGGWVAQHVPSGAGV